MASPGSAAGGRVTAGGTSTAYSALANLYLIRNLPNGADVRPYLSNPDLSYTEKLDRGFGALKVHYHALSYLLGEVDVQVIDERQITISPKTGRYFPSLFEQLYMTSTKFEVGQKVELKPYTATIDGVSEDGEVTRVRFTFPEPLSSPRYTFLTYDGGQWIKVDLATAVAGRMTLRATRWD